MCYFLLQCAVKTASCPIIYIAVRIWNRPRCFPDVLLCWDSISILACFHVVPDSPLTIALSLCALFYSCHAQDIRKNSFITVLSFTIVSFFMFIALFLLSSYIFIFSLLSSSLSVLPSPLAPIRPYTYRSATCPHHSLFFFILPSHLLSISVSSCSSCLCSDCLQQSSQILADVPPAMLQWMLAQK
jgi:hypothetical protein